MEGSIFMSIKSMTFFELLDALKPYYPKAGKENPVVFNYGDMIHSILVELFDKKRRKQYSWREYYLLYIALFSCYTFTFPPIEYVGRNVYLVRDYSVNARYVLNKLFRFPKQLTLGQLKYLRSKTPSQFNSERSLINGKILDFYLRKESKTFDDWETIRYYSEYYSGFGWYLRKLYTKGLIETATSFYDIRPYTGINPEPKDIYGYEIKMYSRKYFEKLCELAVNDRQLEDTMDVIFKYFRRDDPLVLKVISKRLTFPPSD